MFKKCCHLCLFVSLSLLLPVLLYITEGNAAVDYTRGISDGNGCETVKTGKEDFNFKALLGDRDKAAALITVYLDKLDAEMTMEVEAMPGAADKMGSNSGSDKASTEALPKSSEPAPAAVVEPQAPAPSPSADSSKEQQMVNLINQARSNAGLPALQVSSDLTKAARAKSKDMVDKNYFSHTSPTYGSLASMLQHFGISYTAAGENLAMNTSGSVNAAHETLMNSPGHRSNILEPRFSYVGVGIHVRSDGSHYYTQLYIAR